MNVTPETGSFNFPNKLNRRSLLGGAASIPVLAGAMALAGVSSWADLTDDEDQRMLDALKSLRRSTGVSMDTWSDWLSGVSVSEAERVAQNAIAVEDQKPVNTGFADPHRAWLEEWRDIVKQLEADDFGWPVDDPRHAKRWQLVHQISHTKARALAGVLAQAEFAADDAFGLAGDPSDDASILLRSISQSLREVSV